MFDDFTQVNNQFDMEQCLTRSAKPAAAVFYSPKCENCQQVAPILEELARARSDEIQFLKVDVNLADDLVDRYNVRTTPTTIVFKTGKETDRLTNARDPAKYDELMDSLASTAIGTM
jgi:thioredoxin-like negative regulator of GroEL